MMPQNKGNLELYHQKTGQILWSSGTTRSAKAAMQSDGNFVLYTPDSQVEWSTGTAGFPGSYLKMQDDGNLVLYNAVESAVWQTRTITFCSGT